MMEIAPTDVKSRPKNPRGRAKFWADEMEASQKFLRKFHKQGGRVVARYLDERGVSAGSDLQGAEAFSPESVQLQRQDRQ